MSIRLPRQLTTRLDTYAAGKGISRNAAIAVLLDGALRRDRPAPELLDWDASSKMDGAFRRDWPAPEIRDGDGQ